MILDDAIIHAESKAEELKLRHDTASGFCGIEYKQLANWLKELKQFRLAKTKKQGKNCLCHYRPYKDAEEFCNHHELGDFIYIRRKDEPRSYSCVMFTGYQHIDAEIEGSDVIYLGGSFYSINGLFENYEFENMNGDFVPFGVEE